MSRVVKKCPECGMEVVTYARFCPKCRYEFPEDTIYEVPEEKIDDKTKKETLLKELYKITGKTRVTKKYRSLLEKYGLSDEIGLEIKNEIVDLINDDELDMPVKDKFNQLLDEKILIENERIKDDLLSQLDNLTGKFDLSEEYIEKLENKGLTPEIGLIIRKDIKKQIQKGNIRNESIEDILNKYIDDESEKLAEKRESLLKELYKITGKTRVTKKYRSLLEKYGLSDDIGLEIKNEIIDLINDDTLDMPVKDKFNQLLDEKVLIENERIKAELLSQLDNLTGNADLSEDYIAKLESKGLTPEMGLIIRKDIKKQIQTGQIRDESLEEILNNAIDEESKKLAEKRESLLNELYEITGKTRVTKKYRSLLEKNGLSDKIGLEIKNEIVDLINDDELDMPVKDKFNQLLDEKILIEKERIKTELLSQLDELTGKSELSEDYIAKLESKGLTPEIGFNIRKDIQNQIQNGKIRDESIEDLLINIIDEESEKLAKQKEKALIKYLDKLMGKTNLSSQFKSKLDSFNLKHEIGFNIKEEVHGLIKNRTITEEAEVDSKIDELIEIEVIKETKIKEGLLKQLYDIVGEKQLSEEFKSKLQSYNIEEEWGVSLLNSLENDIAARKINPGFDFESHINKLIIDKKQEDLTHQLNDVFNDEKFDSKINENFLNDKDAKKIKSDIMKIIESKDIDAMVELENNDMGQEVNNRILEINAEIKEEILEMRENLLEELNAVVNDEYASKVNSGRVRQETIDKIKKDLEDVIKQDDVFDSKFKYKIDELKDLNDNTVKSTFKSLVDEEKRLEKIELDKIRVELKKELSLLTKDLPTSFINIQLKKYELPKKYASKAENKIIKKIDSDIIQNDEFKFKLDELKYYKQNSLKTEVIKVIEELRSEVDENLSKLYEITGKDNLTGSFKTSLSRKGLNENAGWKIVNEVKEDIINEKPFGNIRVKINNRLNQMEIEKNKTLDLLEDKLGPDANKFFFSVRLGKRNLNPETHGMTIKRNMETLIESAEVTSNNFDDALRKELDEEVVRKNNRLREQLAEIIGLNVVNKSFLNKISQYNLNATDALKIKTTILNSINDNKIEENMLEDEINKLILTKGNVRSTELSIIKVNDIIGKGSINANFIQRLNNHDLDISHGRIIRDDAIKQIKKGNLNLNNIEGYIEVSMDTMDRDNVKNELNNLSSDAINSIMKKHSLSGLLPFKSAKINKLMDNVSLSDLKTDLAGWGIARYKVKYSSAFTSGSNNNNNFCSNCGAKLDNGDKFCSSCGTKVE